MKKAVFLDKDGTLIKNVPYNVNPALIELKEGVIEGLKKIQEQGYLLIVISNQSGVARGYFTEDALIPVKEKITDLLKEENITIDGFFYCPHHPQGTVSPYNISCDCRKPLPGLILKAAQKMNIELSASWMVGDILDDVEAGKRAGCRAVLINNGHETIWHIAEKREPDFMAGNIQQAAEQIINSANHQNK